MAILVAYASKHGATKGIAERIAGALREAERQAEARPVKDVTDVGRYEAFVIGSAAYFGHWRREATTFVRTHRAALANRPVWLYSSGPLGTDATDAKGNDLRVVSVPQEIAELTAAIGPREHRIFFGALERRRLDLGERLLALLPAARTLFPEGDFRDWQEIDAWAKGIAQALAADQRR